MKKNTVATWGIVILMLVSLFGTVAAQTGTMPETSPTPTAEPGAKFFTHPVVKLLSAYFDRETAEDPTATVTPDPSATPEAGAESGLGPIGEQIAAYHEEGMGFGVLVKIYAMAEASKAACDAQATVTPAAGETATEPACTPVTAEELVTQFKSGTGMGQLFKEYGKPAMMGVGHVKHAAEALDGQTTDETTSTDATKGHKPDKTGKNGPKNGKGPKK